MEDQEIVLDPEETALQREARMAGYRKTIADGVAASAPDLSVEVPDRSLDVGDGVSQLPGLVAQDVADELADEIVRRIITDCSVVGRTVVIVSDIDVTEMSGLGRRMLRTMSRLTERLELAAKALVPPTAAAEVPLPKRPRAEERDDDRDNAEDIRRLPGLMMGFGPAVVVAGMKGLEVAAKALPAVLELVKTDVTVRPSPVEVSDEVVVAAVARSLRQRDVMVRIASCTVTPDNEVTSGLDALADLRDSLADAVATFVSEHLEGGRAAAVARQHVVLAGLMKVHDSLLDEDEPRAELQERISLLRWWLAEHEPAVDTARAAAVTATTLVEQVDAFLGSCDQPGAAGMTPATVAALFHEITCEGSTTDVLQLRCTLAVGETVWKERWRGDQALHAGGLGASWVLVGRDGLVRSSGEHTAARSVELKLGEPLHWR